jgi:D-glycero-D-manno-heptose 1,7-bisphosphate phosphatase
MIGDRWRDIEAGQRAGCTTLFIDYNYAEAKLGQFDIQVSSLTQATDWILTKVD